MDANQVSDTLRMLPYGNPWDRISQAHLESVADGIVNHSSLFTRVASGEKDAVRAYFVGAWPFVNPFGSNIYKFSPPLRLLIDNLGADRARDVLTGTMAVFKEMSEEEGEHAGLWIEDAKCIGIQDLDAAAAQMPMVEHVQELTRRSRSSNPLAAWPSWPRLKVWRKRCRGASPRPRSSSRFSMGNTVGAKRT